MKIIISPAKSINFEKKIPTEKNSLPFFLDDAVVINSNLKKKTPLDLSNLMNISSKLSDLNWRRNQEFKIPFNKNNARPAIYAFDGDVYSGIDSYSLDQDKIDIIQERLFIISGLYGLLKPLDLIQPYRLEMGTKLKNKVGKDLYEYWGDTLSNSISEELRNHQHNVVVNCASIEYFRSIDRPSLNAEVITPQFKEYKNGKLKMISFFAKRARGMMARYIIQNKINDGKDILSFNLGGYSYDPSISSPASPVFTRTQA